MASCVTYYKEYKDVKTFTLISITRKVETMPERANMGGFKGGSKSDTFLYQGLNIYKQNFYNGKPLIE